MVNKRLTEDTLLINNLRKQNFKKFSKFWLGIISGIVFFYLALRNTEFEKILGVIQSTLLVPLLVSMAISIFGLALRGLRWRILIKPVKKIAPMQVFRILCIGELFNYLLPARMGEVLRVMMIAKKENIGKGIAFASVFVDRLLDLLTLLVLIISIYFAFTLPNVIKEAVYFISYLLVIIGAGFILILCFKHHVKRISQGVFSLFPNLAKRFHQFLKSFYHGLNIMGDVRQMIQASAVSFVLWGIYSASLYFVFVAMNIDLPWYASLVTVIVVGFGMSIPSTPGFIGTTEFFYVATLTLFSVNKNTALACALISHGLQYFTIVGVGLICYFWENVPFRALKSSNTSTFVRDTKNLKVS